MRLYLMLIFIFLIRYSHSKDDAVYTEQNNFKYKDLGLQNERFHIVKTLSTGLDGNYDTLLLEVYQDIKYNLYLLLKDKEGFLIDIAGSPSSDLESRDNFVFEYKLNKEDTLKEYVVKTANISSTYGALEYYVIWGSYNGAIYKWHLTNLGLQRPFIEDRDSDGIYEIVEYYNSKNKNGEVFHFQNGKLIPGMNK